MAVKEKTRTMNDLEFECKFIAKMFNNKARAKLVVRWKELELDRNVEMVGKVIMLNIPHCVLKCFTFGDFEWVLILMTHDASHKLPQGYEFSRNTDVKKFMQKMYFKKDLLTVHPSEYILPQLSP